MNPGGSGGPLFQPPDLLILGRFAAAGRPVFKITLAQAMPMVRTTSSMRCFRPVSTCSITERIAERLALALAMHSGIGPRDGFLWRMWLVAMPMARIAPLFFNR